MKELIQYFSMLTTKSKIKWIAAFICCEWLFIILYIIIIIGEKADALNSYLGQKLVKWIEGIEE